MTIVPLFPVSLRSVLQPPPGEAHDDAAAGSYDVDTDLDSDADPGGPRSMINILAELAAPFDLAAEPDVVLASVVATARQLVTGSAFAALRCRSRAHWSVLAGADIASHRYGALQAAANQGSSIVVCAMRDTRQYEPLSVGVQNVHGGHPLASCGIAQVVVAPIGPPHDAFGTFNWYLQEEADDDTVEAAGWLAHHAALAYLHARDRHGLGRAAEMRLVIGQAEGILMARFEIGPEQAAAVLRRLSRDSNVKLTRIAAEIVRSRMLPPSARDGRTRPRP